jgi:integrase
MKLDKKTIAGLKLPDAKPDAIYFDNSLRGFGLRVRARGDEVRRSWIVQYRRAGATRRMLLGSAEVLTADQARAAAKKTLAAIALGQDPQAEKTARRSTDKLILANMIEDHLAAKQSAVRARTFAEVQRYLRGPYFKSLHGMPVDSITRRDVAARLLVITRENGVVAASNARGALSELFTWALANGLAEANPIIGTARPRMPPPRDRVLSDIELAAIWRAAGDDSFGRIVKLLMLLAQRRTEVGGICWSELDLKEGTWTIPSRRSKNGRAHMLPLPPLALEIIADVPRMVGRDTLFGARVDSGLTGWARPKAALDARLGSQVESWRLHDLRRSAATRMCDLGVAPHVVEEILNHRSGHRSGVRGIYNRSTYTKEVRMALEMWNNHIGALTEVSECNDITMHPKVR